jgi:hypothetical protein
MNGKYQDTPDDTAFEFRVREPVYPKNDWRNGWPKDDPFSKITYREGSYRKSNVRLKNGAWVFEWMGWYEKV